MKNHPLYALECFLGKYECLIPVNGASAPPAAGGNGGDGSDSGDGIIAAEPGGLPLPRKKAKKPTPVGYCEGMPVYRWVGC